MLQLMLFYSKLRMCEINKPNTCQTNTNTNSSTNTLKDAGKYANKRMQLQIDNLAIHKSMRVSNTFKHLMHMY